MNRLKFIMPEEFDFFPNTYLLPKEKARLKKEWNDDQIMIVKPEASCQGKGIYLVREMASIEDEACVV